MFKLGDRVAVQAFLYPRKEWDDAKRKTKRVWRRFPLGNPERGIICGKRTGYEGDIDDYGEEGGRIFSRTRNVPHYLVAMSMGKMLRVLPEDVTDAKSCAP